METGHLVSFRCAGTTTWPDVEAELEELLPGARFEYSVCFSETPPVSVSIVADLISLAKQFGPEATLGFLLLSGKKLHESIAGFQGAWELLRPGEKRRLAQVRALLAKRVAPAELHLHVSGRLFTTRPADSITVSFEDEGDPDDQVAVLAVGRESLEAAIRSLRKRGWRITDRVTVGLSERGFDLHWHDEARSAYFVVQTDEAGRVVGDVVDETALVEAKFAEALRRAFGIAPGG